MGKPFKLNNQGKNRIKTVRYNAGLTIGVKIGRTNDQGDYYILLHKDIGCPALAECLKS